jgi:hypothetical protein
MNNQHPRALSPQAALRRTIVTTLYAMLSERILNGAEQARSDSDDDGPAGRLSATITWTWLHSGAVDIQLHYSHRTTIKAAAKINRDQMSFPFGDEDIDDSDNDDDIIAQADPRSPDL